MAYARSHFYVRYLNRDQNFYRKLFLKTAKRKAVAILPGSYFEVLHVLF